MFALIALSLLFSLIPNTSYAADCIDKACIDVYIQDGKIVIEGRKGSGAVERKAVAPAPAKSRKPAVRRTFAPKVRPTVVGSIKPKVRTSTKKPVVHKRAIPTPTSTATSLSDKLVELLPTTAIAYSPAFEPLIKVPVYFWSDVPKVVQKKISIVGEEVEVSLTPTFLWHYGDGVFFATKKFGAPYPDGEIQHSYSNPGHYLIELVTNWSGTFSTQGVQAPIPGQVRTVSILPITVVAAPTRFTPPITYRK